jgi:hypothetical protein
MKVGFPANRLRSLIYEYGDSAMGLGNPAPPTVGADSDGDDVPKGEHAGKSAAATVGECNLARKPEKVEQGH